MVAATEVMVDRPCFEVEFSDGEVIVADAEHQWVTFDAAARAGSTGARWRARLVGDERWSDRGGRRCPCRTTAELAAGLYAGADLNHAIPTCAAAADPAAERCRSTRGRWGSCWVPAIRHRRRSR